MIFFVLNNNKSMVSRKGGNTLIAYWNFDDNMNKTNKSISLANTITNSETQVANGYIAPGMEGKFYIIVNNNNSNMNINYEVHLVNEKSVPSNLYFYIIKDDKKMKYSSISELFEKVNFSGNLLIGEKKVYEIFWKWPYETKLDDGSIDISKDEADMNFIKKERLYNFEFEILVKQ